MNSSSRQVLKKNHTGISQYVYDFIKRLGRDYLNASSDMMIFDAVICNTDRHFGNYGLMVDNKPTALFYSLRSLTMACRF